ncbi:hypothetical protein VP01_1866g6 [Puccinia sorghi]|uniref:Nuclear segregation protein Bfr1 n=1 Tax=Puccinia sorghi TaxID=27349 RepID=A0A0L6VDW8_9BASI|nr:hypothetical protein VP01_1866g6 [Puccinia sorghi]
MPPKSTPASAKTASIPNRPKNIDKHLKGTAAGGEGSGGLPSKDVYSQEQEQYQRDIDSLKTQVSEVRLKISESQTGAIQGPLLARRKVLREEMDAIREEQSKRKDSRGRLLDQIKVANDSLQRKIKELNANRAKLPYKSSAEVDAKIRQLESQIESGTMKIVEEKKALMEIQNLRKTRKLVDAFEPQQEIIEAEKQKVEKLRKQLDDPQSKSGGDRWSEIKRELDEINAKLDESSKSRDKLFEERNKLQDALTEVFNKKKESATRRKEAKEKYYAKMQEDQQRRIAREKAERESQQRAELEKVHSEMREQAAFPAYEREIEDCRTLILHFDKLMGNAPSTGENPTPGLKSTVSSNLPQIKEIRTVDGNDGFQGMVAIKKKGAEEEEFFMGGGKKNKKNKKSTTEVPSNNQSLNLPLSTINALYALAAPVPMTREDVTQTIATLSEKKNWFTENQARVTKERIDETEAKIAAALGKFQINPTPPAEPIAESGSTPVEEQAESPDAAPQ